MFLLYIKKIDVVLFYIVSSLEFLPIEEFLPLFYTINFGGHWLDLLNAGKS